MQLIVVGAGGVTRDLLRGLSEAWQVTVVDTDQTRLDAVQGVRVRAAVAPESSRGDTNGRKRGGETRLQLGDGTSRVVLERAGLERADAVVAAAGDDRANLEVCRIAKAAGVARIAAVAAGPENIQDYRNEEFAAFSPAQLTARRLEIQLEPRRVSSAAFAEGLAQAVEFRIAADSPLIARPLRELELERTLVAAISRRGTLIVPHGETALQEGDLVTVICATADYQMVVRTFTTAAARFPTDLGRLVAVRLHSRDDLERLVPAAIHLVRNSAAEELLLLHATAPEGADAEPSPGSVPLEDEVDEVDDGDEVDDEGAPAEEARVAAREAPPPVPAQRLEPIPEAPTVRELIEIATQMAEGITVSEAVLEQGSADAVITAARAANAAVAVVPPPGGRFATVRLLRAAEAQRMAVLIAQGTDDEDASVAYRAILAPARETPAGRAASQAAIDLAVHGQAQLTGIAVRPPTFMAGGEARAEAVAALARMREAASVQGIYLRRMVREGNPVHILRAEAAKADLLVIGLPAETPRVWAPGVAGHLVLRAPCSVLLVPRTSREQPS